MIVNQVIRAIDTYSKFLITSHVGLEGDALGSELALSSLLRKLGKTVYIVNEDRVPQCYNFLPGINKICRGLRRPDFQAAFIIDCADIERIGRVIHLVDRKPIINIDHHLGNKNFGKINWVDPGASSIGEMIYTLFKLTQRKLDKDDATNIYTAILTDTGSFRYSNTTSHTLYICSQLLRSGINPVEIYSKIYENNSLQDAIYMARIISRISFAANNRIAWAEINKSEFKKLKGKQEIFDRIFDFAKSIKTVKVIVIFCQLNRGLVKLKFRSKSPVDVQRIAAVFGGGGHRFASGCLIKATLKEAKQAVFREIEQALTT